MLSGIQRDLLSDEAFLRFQQHAAEVIKKSVPDLDALKRRLTEAARVRENILAALRAGIITASTRDELVAAENAVKQASDELEAAKTHQPESMMPRAREAWRDIVASLADRARNLPAARQALRDLLGEVSVRANKNGDILAEVAVSSTSCKPNVVAGAGFEPATFGL